MKKIIINKAGDCRQLIIIEEKIPQIQATEVLIKVSFIGINYADVLVRWGVYSSAKEYVGWPITPGFELSGIIEQVGSQVTKYKVGDRVFGITRFGAYTTHIALDEEMVFRVPIELSLEQAAAFPAVYLTAYHALFQNIIIPANAKILIHSCAGGVGSALLQLCRFMGHESIGIVGSSHKVEVAKKLGANYVIDKSTQSLWREAERISPNGFDVILDANGASTLKDSYDHLAPSGKLLCYGFHSMLPKQGGKLNYFQLVWTYLKTPSFNPLNMTEQNKSLITFNLSYLFDKKEMIRQGMVHLIELIDSKKISGPSVTIFPFEEVGEAHRAIESGQTTGKIVLSCLE